MQYINTITLDYPVTEYQIRQAFPNTSFPKEFVAPEPYAPVQPTTPPTFDKMTQKLQELTPVQANNVWQQSWEVVALSPEEIAKNEQNARNANKSQASHLLTETDWVELNDVTDPENPPFLSNKTEFTQYRSAVREIAVNPPVTVTEWPVKPEEIWSTE